jgi:hypothetical protein
MALANAKTITQIVFPSATRTATPDTFEFENPHFRFAKVVLRITGVPTNQSSLNLYFDNWNPAAGAWLGDTLASATQGTLDSTSSGSGLQVASTGHTQILLKGPFSTGNSGVGAEPSTYSQYITSGLVDERFRIRVSHSNSESWTYSVCLTLGL